MYEQICEESKFRYVKKNTMNLQYSGISLRWTWYKDEISIRLRTVSRGID